MACSFGASVVGRFRAILDVCVALEAARAFGVSFRFAACQLVGDVVGNAESGVERHGVAGVFDVLAVDSRRHCDSQQLRVFDSNGRIVGFLKPRESCFARGNAACIKHTGHEQNGNGGHCQQFHEQAIAAGCVSSRLFPLLSHKGDVSACKVTESAGNIKRRCQGGT